MVVACPGASPCRPIFRIMLSAFLFAIHVAYAQECNYAGGWSLRFPSSSCPQDAPFECGKAGGLQVRCCPSGLSCAGNGSYDGNYCCPDSTDCSSSAYTHPKCPDPSWSMWVANDTVNDKPDTGAWCCKPDYKGVYRDNGTANYFCTATSISTLQLSYYWAHILTTTTSCSLTATQVGLSTATSTLLSSVTPNATSVGTRTGTASSTGTRSESTGTTSPASEEQTGIPIGVKVGAAVGCVAGAALIVAGILFIRKRKQKTIEGVTLTGDTEEGRGKPEAKYFYKGTRRPSELETVERTVELDGARPRYELDATRKEDQYDVVSPMSM
ncbi:WSC2 protein [Colletotrichum scovillei]|uniref:WSC2 protein n=1 Tax=Colletotrichum scovillei TaxID=1209932 RepID=A0A9P7QT30_9PEZI|nr:WSC2 protein [Colletotrichum scovillei]KAG7042047.1 WSC2 protein [Colletotrichum scovillei]KAG7062078.1 WSC2 protein [Colletotrichum scovillei]